MIIDVSQEDLELLIHALDVLQDNDGRDDGAEELEGRLRALREQLTATDQKHMAKLQEHLGKYFELTQPLPYEPHRLVGVRLHREASAHVAALNVAEALMFCAPLWKIIREWKREA